MKVYLAIKYKEDYSDKEFVTELGRVLEDAGYDTVVAVRDFEEWGRRKIEPAEMMKWVFREISSNDAIILEVSEKGVGLGIEAGYAHAWGKPVVVIAKTGTHISETLEGIAKHIILYDSWSDLAQKIKVALQ